MGDRSKVLFVDDEPELLEAIKLNFRKRFNITTADSGAKALAFLGFAEDGPAPVDAVVSDMRMPKMSGAVFLKTVRERHPEMPLILLSGQSDLSDAIAVINDAQVFRFLTKPCPNEVLASSLDEAIELARLKQVEAELLEKTLNGAVSMLTEVTGLISTEGYSRSVRIGELIKAISTGLRRRVAWDLQLAAMLSQVGYVVLPEGDLEENPDLNETRVAMGRDLLVNIPRLETVAHLVGTQLEPTGHPPELPIEAWTDDDLNREILRTAVAYDAMMSDGVERLTSIRRLTALDSPPPTFITDALSNYEPDRRDLVEIQIGVKDLVAGMELTSDVVMSTGSKLASPGTPLTSALIQRIRAFSKTSGIEEPISVRVSAAQVARIKS
ncbi:MAG: response regulator [Actinomycetota bacterium]